MSNNSLLKDCNSWSDFQDLLKTFNNKEKGNAFELLTKLYFNINPLYEQYDDVWLFDDVPTKELEYLGLPSHDLGIDLIAKQGNEYHAIQCKYHSDKTSSVTFKEVSTFISLLESNDKISQGYICSSADVTSRNFNKLKTKPINLIMSDSWQLLDEEFFNQVRKILDGKKIKLIPFQPREHQKKALKESKNYFIKEDHSRGKLIFPCGAGKSLTGFWMTQELKSKSTIIAVPSLSLVKQTLEVYLREIVAKNKRIKWLCICSDEGIGKNDDVAIFTENLGVPCQTDPTYIEQWLKDNIDEEKIIFTTYQSGRIIAEISKRLNFTFDVGIFDEAHKTVGSNKKLFSHLLFEENISIEKRIFMTATERFYAGSKDDIISMDDEDIYGDTFTQMSFKEAIEIGLLTDYKVITIDIKKSEIAEFIRDNKDVQLNDKWKKETEARSLASMLALRKAMKQFNIKNAVSFHSSIEKAVRNKELQKYITDTYDYEPIDTYTVSGKQSTSKRNDIVQEFANSPKALITNARCLTEGVDVPNIDCIVFADPRKSRVDIVQALGRALRKKEGKDWGYVILPVVYDEETQEIDNDSFNTILDVVRGLASNDERIVDYFKDKSQEKGGKKKDSIEQFNFEVFSDYMDESQLSEQLQIMLWDKLAKYDWMSFEEARDYVHKLELKTQKEWRKWKKTKKKPANLTAKPERVYKNGGWMGFRDWLGTKSGWNGEWEEFSVARNFVRGLGLKNQNEWESFAASKKKPFNIPVSPVRTYENKGWLGMGDWLGTYVKHKKDFISFEEARDLIRTFELKNQKDWRDWRKSKNCPDNFPSQPENTYKSNGWLSFGDFIGTTPGWNGEFITYSDAKKELSKFNVKSKSEWYKFSKSKDMPINIPVSPYRAYKEEWKSWGDFLGSNRIAPQNLEFVSYENATKLVQEKGIKSFGQFQEFKLREDFSEYNLPRAPDVVYKNKGWNGFPAFFGKNIIDKYDYIEAKAFIRNKGIKTQREWGLFAKTNRPDFIPSNPSKFYKEDWKGWNDFFGREKQD